MVVKVSSSNSSGTLAPKKMALDVGKIFYAEKRVTAYNRLGIGRLIYQLPVNLCQIFIDEIFGANVPDELDEETLTTINKFFENNLSVLPQWFHRTPGHSS